MRRPGLWGPEGRGWFARTCGRNFTRWFTGGTGESGRQRGQKSRGSIHVCPSPHSGWQAFALVLTTSEVRQEAEKRELARESHEGKAWSLGAQRGRADGAWPLPGIQGSGSTLAVGTVCWETRAVFILKSFLKWFLKTSLESIDSSRSCRRAGQRTQGLQLLSLAGLLEPSLAAQAPSICFP